MNLGANSRNIKVLAVLLPSAAFAVYSSFFSSGSSPAVPAPPAVKIPEKLKTIDLAQDSARAVAGGGPRNTSPPLISRGGNTATRRNTSQEWTPRVGGRRPEDRADPAKTDPTLHLELLARLQNVPTATAGRSLFDFSAAPVKVPDDVKILPKGAKPPEAAKAAMPPPPGPTGPPAEPPPPPIPLKFYGFVQGEGGRRAFFRIGEEDIFVASEGQTVQNRYRIVRIGLSAAVVEDTQVRNNQQSLRLEEIPKENL